MNYFAYGSNMAVARLRRRTRSARFIGVYRLQHHDLRFHKVGQDGSGKCDAFFTGLPGHFVAGVVFEVERREVGFLDRIEGVGYGYEKKTIRIVNGGEHWMKAFAYFATRIDDSLKPFSWYKEHVLAGAKSAGLDPDYTARIQKVKAIPDPDPARERRELSIHRR